MIYKARNQKGSVLIIALVFLLLLTIAGVSAMRLVRVDVQATGATIERSYAVQASEAALIQAEQFVHQRLANFNAIQFFETQAQLTAFNDAQTVSTSECAPSGTTICFVENSCVNGFCMPGRYNATARVDMVNAVASDPAAIVGAQYIYPIGSSPTQLAIDFPSASARENEISNRLAQAKTTKFWETEANFTNSTLGATVRVPVVSNSGFAISNQQEALTVPYIIEFVGFNLDQGAVATQATQAANLPPSNSWLMTYRVTAMVSPSGGETIFDGSRTMIQALYTRRLPANIPMVVGVRNNYITSDDGSGAGGFTALVVNYGCDESVTPTDWNDPNCRFGQDIAPVAANNYKTGDAVFLSDGTTLDYHKNIEDTTKDILGDSIRRNATDNSARDNAIDLPAMSQDEYFELYFNGMSKKKIYQLADGSVTPAAGDPTVVKVTPQDGQCSGTTAGDTAVASAEIVVFDGTINMDATDHPLYECDFARGARVLIRGNLNYTGGMGTTDIGVLDLATPGTPSDGVGAPPWEVSLIYSMGKASWDVDTAGNYTDTAITHAPDGVDVKRPSVFSASARFYSMLAFEEDLSINQSLLVEPKFPIGAQQSQIANQTRSRYAWRELDFPF